VTDTGASLASGIKIYRNATLQTNTVDSDTLTSNSIQNNDALTLLARDGGGSKFTGVLDDVRYFDRAISPAEISKLYAEQLTTDNEVSRFKFNWDTLDYVGSNHGIVTGTERYADSNFPFSQTFNGNTYTTIANETKFDFNSADPFSITFWSWLPSTLGQNTIFAKTNDWVGTTSAGYGVGYNTTGYVFFKVNDGTVVISKDTNAATSLNAWNFFSVTKGTGLTDAALKIYKNGVDVTNGNEAGTLGSTILNNLSPVIGAESDTGRKADNGVKLDEVRVYSKELSSSEVNTIYGNYDISVVYSDTGLARFTQYSYKATAVNRIGESAVTSFSNATTFDVPSAPTSLTATPITGTRIDLSWNTPADNGGSSIIGYRVERNQTTIDNFVTLVNNTGTTTTTYSDTTVSQNHQERYRVAAWNTFGLGAYSNSATATTQENTSGLHYINSTVIADIVGVQSRIKVVTGLPFPNVTKLQLYNGSTLLETKNLSPTVQITKGETKYINFTFYKILTSPSTLKVNATLTNTTGTVIITSNATVVSPAYTYTGDLNYTHTRTASYTKLDLNVLRKPINFNLECNYRSSTQGTGDWINVTSVGYFSKTKLVVPYQNVYVTCYGSGQILSFTSYGATNGTLTLINFANEMGTLFGVPIPFFFVILFTALWTGRSAPTGIIALAAVIGLMGVMGYFTDPVTNDPLITATIWSFIILLVALGIFIGKRFL
jgi:hypothetical protein